ncbi:Zinc finger SWIM-type [Arabidopsis thaliana x Arabidopsis arenosa]|uniref:Zinc finger SWIM-type n=1 Tax=Arabidopsis thaliana x Arabidopsis arenosa TaxID=1240361 RepID=A0A8T2AA32_9BRAS|nr:Zinc finger SWIM-type [Arabidopsis thaliana x Arabidopsis arenosa]
MTRKKRFASRSPEADVDPPPAAVEPPPLAIEPPPDSGEPESVEPAAVVEPPCASVVENNRGKKSKRNGKGGDNRGKKSKLVSKRQVSAEDKDKSDGEGLSDVAGDDDFDEVQYADEEDGNRLGVEEEACEDFEAHFGPAARDDGDVSDADSGDDIWDEDRIPDPFSDSDHDEDEVEDETREQQPDDPEELLKLGKTYSSPEEFKIAVLRYSLKSRFDIKLYKSQSLKVGAKCSDTDVKCGWRCYCSYDKKKHKMQIKVYENKHICVRSGYSKMLKRGTIAWLFSERLRKNPKITKYEMVDEIQREYNLTVTEEQCSKAKTKVMRERKAIHDDHFSRIWDYQAEIFKSNSETTFEIETIPGPTIGSLQRFHRLFICFKSQKESWKRTCRPILGLDGAFLKWDVKGHLLAATGRDGDNRIVPIAWAVVEIENDDNWDWFVRLLAVNLDLQDGRNTAVISDKQSGLVKAIHNRIPAAEHRQCAKHIMDNWKRNSHDMELQRLFWKIARSYTIGEYTANLEALKTYNPGAAASLMNTKPMEWSRAFFKIGSCCNDNLNNLSESFNKTIRQARRKPLLDMLEDIRSQCMVRNEKRYIIAGRRKSRFTKRAHEEIEKMIAGSQFCERSMARHNKHEISHFGGKYSVDMNANTCGCRKWQMTGIPCVHAASVIIGKKQKVEDYVSDWYTTRMWQLTYNDGIAPVQGQLLWPRVNRNQGMFCLDKDFHKDFHKEKVLKDHSLKELHHTDHKVHNLKELHHSDRNHMDHNQPHKEFHEDHKGNHLKDKD